MEMPLKISFLFNTMTILMHVSDFFFVYKKKDTILQPTSSRRPDGSAPVKAAIIILVRVAPR
jgi:hypothetical protein